MVKNLIAFIPARANSKRVPNKNIRDFFGHPLIAYAIQSAIDAGIFDAIYVSSDSWDICKIATSYGACYIQRPAEFARDDSPDAEWIKHAKSQLLFERFAILRPTNPFRTGATIESAWYQWDKHSHMKAVEPAKQHPEKMWRLVHPEVIQAYGHAGMHLLPTQCLEKLYVQNASLEFRSLAAALSSCQPFFAHYYEGFDINTPEDWILAEELVKRGLAKLPEIRRPSI